MPRLGRLKGKKIVWKCKFFTFFFYLFRVSRGSPDLFSFFSHFQEGSTLIYGKSEALCPAQPLRGNSEQKRTNLNAHTHCAFQAFLIFTENLNFLAGFLCVHNSERGRAVRKLLPRYFVSWTRNPDGEYPPDIWRISVTSRMRSVNFANYVIKENNCIYWNHHGGLISNNKK